MVQVTPEAIIRAIPPRRNWFGIIKEAPDTQQFYLQVVTLVLEKPRRVEEIAESTGVGLVKVYRCLTRWSKQGRIRRKPYGSAPSKWGGRPPWVYLPPDPKKE